jgi:hypothetical protein
MIPHGNQCPQVLWGIEPRLWLEDYQLACQASDADDDYFIICNIPLFLADSAWTWLDHLPPNSIKD